MFTKSKLYKIITVVVMLCVVWGLFFSIRFLNEKQESKLEQFIPVEASAVLRINNKEIVKRFLGDILFKNNFDRKERAKFEKKSFDSNYQGFGIDFGNDVIVFFEEWHKENVIGFLFNINNETNFEKLSNSKDVFTSSINGKGCLLYLPLKQEINSKTFKSYANDILVENSDKSFAKLNLQKVENTTEHFNLFLTGNSSSTLTNVLLELKIEGNKINIEGTGVKNPLYKKDTLRNYFISKEDANALEFNVGSLPDTIKKYIDAVLVEANIQLPKIQSQHLLFYGIGLENIDGTMAVQPNFDGIFRFKDSLSINDEAVKFSQMSEKIISSEKNKINIGNTTYYIKQISNNDIFIGVSKNPEIIEDSIAPIFFIKGRPEALIQINGEGWMAQMARSIPQVRNLNDFFKEIYDFKIEALETTDNQVKITGEIAFNKNDVATLKLVDLILSFIKAPKVEVIE